MPYYVNIIESEIENIFNLIFNNLIQNNKLKMLLKNENINKLNELFNNEIDKYLYNVSKKKVQDNLKKKENYDKLLIMIKKYITFYILLFSSQIINNNDNFRNLIIKLDKVNNNKILINDNVQVLLKIFEFLEKYIKVLKLYKKDPKNFNENIKKDLDKYKLVLIFINNEIGADEFNKIKGNDNEIFHICLFQILIYKIYIKEDIKIVYNLLEEDYDNKYTFINIILPIVNYIDQNSIKNILDLSEQKTQIINDFNDLLRQKKIILNSNKKINKLLKLGFITPIVEDFLRYNKSTEIYQFSSDKKNTKLGYIINRINDFQNYYDVSEKEQKKLDSYIYNKLVYRKAILYNELEEISIIRKLFLQGKKTLENNEFIDTLLDIRNYSYLNFNNFKNIGTKLNLEDTTTLVRYNNIEYNDKKYNDFYNNNIELRVQGNNNANVVGFLLTKNKLNNIKVKDVKQIIKNDKSLNTMLNTYLSNNKDNNNYYWIFDKSDNKYIDNQKFIDLKDSCNQCKYIFLYIYEILSDYIYSLIINKLDKIKSYNSIYYYKRIINLINEQYFNIDTLLENNNINQKLYYDYLKNIKDIEDKNESIIKGLGSNVIKLPIIKGVKKKSNIMVFKTKKEKEIDININNLGICQHHLDFMNVNKLKKQKAEKYSENLYNFVKKYAEINYNNEYICRSCKEMLNIKNYVINVFSDGGSEGKEILINTNIDIKDNPKYKPYSKIIDFIDKLVDKIALISNIIIYTGNTNESKFNRRRIIKRVIDLIVVNYERYSKLKQEKKDKPINYEQFYGIEKNYSQFYLFKLTDDIFKFKSKDIDKFKKQKINNILCYIVLVMILDMSKFHIVNLNTDKLCNLIIYRRTGINFFNKLNIIINSSYDKVNISNYSSLCYILFYFGCMLTKYKLWYSDNSKFDLVQIKIFINTILNIIVYICQIKENKINYIYQDFTSNFYFKLNKLFKDNSLIKLIDEKQNKTINYDKNKNIIKLDKSSLPSIYLNNKLVLSTVYKKNVFAYKSTIYKIKLKKYVNNSIYFTDQELKNIRNQFILDNNNKIVKYYNTDNSSRKFVLTDKELEKVDKTKYNTIIQNNKKIKNNIIYNTFIASINLNNKNNKNITNYNSLLDNTNENLKKYKLDILDKLISNLKKIFNEYLFINNINIYIDQDQFIISTDINANNLEKNIYILEKNVKKIYNHNYFKTDVYLIINKKYQMFYDIYTLQYLGFKDNTTFVKAKKIKFLRIAHSIKNSLLLLGIYKNYELSKNINDDYLFNLNYNRDTNIKKNINIFIKHLFLLKNNYKESEKNSILKKYVNTIENINLNNNKNYIFNKNYIISNNITIDSKYEVDTKNKYVNLKKLVSKNILNNIFYLNKANDNIIIFKIFVELLYGDYKYNIDSYQTLNILLYKQLMTFENVSMYDDLSLTEGNYYELKDDLTEEQQKEKQEMNYSNEESAQALDYERNDEDDFSDDEVLFTNDD